MTRACLLVLAALTFSCENISNAVDDLRTIELGEEELSAVEIDRSVTLGSGQIPLCLDVSVTVPASDTTVALMNSPDGCTLTLREPSLELIDEQGIERARDAKGDFEVDGVRTGSVEVQQLQLWNGEGASLMLSSYVAALSVQLDGELLLDRIDPATLQGDAKLTRALPASVIAKLKDAINASQAATADVVLTLWLRDQTLREFPESLRMHLVLQPLLEVDAVEATF
jgi:hypothetical protein